MTFTKEQYEQFLAELAADNDNDAPRISTKPETDILRGNWPEL